MTAADCTNTWAGPGDVSFTSPTGWVPGPPANAPTTVICVSAGGAIQESGTWSIRGVVVSGTGILVVDGGTLTLAEQSPMSGGTVVVSGATLNVPATPASGGTSPLVLAGDGGLAAQITGGFSMGDLQLAGGDAKLIGANVAVNGAPTLAAGYLQLSSASTVTTTGTLSITGTQIRLFDTSKVSSGGAINMTGGWVQAHQIATDAALSAGAGQAINIAGAFDGDTDLRVGVYGPLKTSPRVNLTGGATASFGPLRDAANIESPTPVTALQIDPNAADRTRDAVLETIVSGDRGGGRLKVNGITVAQPSVINGTVRILTEDAYAQNPKAGDQFTVVTGPISGTPRFETRAFTLTPSQEFAYFKPDETLRIRRSDNSMTAFGYQPILTAGSSLVLQVVNMPLPAPGTPDPSQGAPVVIGGPGVGGTQSGGSTAGGGDLKPVRDAGARTLVAKRLRTGALRATIGYRLRQPCTTACRAIMELHYRNGKQLFAKTDPKGTGRQLSAARVRLQANRKAKTVHLLIRKAALKGVRWKRVGAFRILPVRLIVRLPQADGRTLITVRDGVLRQRVLVVRHR